MWAKPLKLEELFHGLPPAIANLSIESCPGASKLGAVIQGTRTCQAILLAWPIQVLIYSVTDYSQGWIFSRMATDIYIQHRNVTSVTFLLSLLLAIWGWRALCSSYHLMGRLSYWLGFSPFSVTTVLPFLLQWLQINILGFLFVLFFFCVWCIIYSGIKSMVLYSHSFWQHLKLQYDCWSRYLLEL